ncbi:hypothetical protein BKA62DRAFT_723281 [Auriculariales sp. MPI-PUGE-AT-0066]|nr:hypothetical protein BKA62DRAFT_723281 [Auriculariales sp. MPI-PUGE-AT-0066]
MIPEHSNTVQSGALPFPWLDPSIATGEFDFGIMDSPAAMDNGLSMTVAAPTNLVGLGPSLVPTNHFTHRFHCIPFRLNVLPAIGGPSIAPFACNAPPQNPSYLPDPWFMQSLGASSSNPYGTPAPRQFPQYYPQPAPFPQWSAPAAWPHTLSMTAARLRGTVSTILLRWPRHRLCQWATSKDQDR